MIVCEAKEIARHLRSYGEEESLFNPVHYLAVLERKTRAFDQAAPLKNWNLPPIFLKAQKILEDRGGKAGKREYIRILRLLETHTLEEVTKGLLQAHQLGSLSAEIVQHLLLSKGGERPEALDLKSLSKSLPLLTVHLTKASSYTQLIGAES